MNILTWVKNLFTRTTVAKNEQLSSDEFLDIVSEINDYIASRGMSDVFICMPRRPLRSDDTFGLAGCFAIYDFEDDNEYNHMLLFTRKTKYECIKRLDESIRQYYQPSKVYNDKNVNINSTCPRIKKKMRNKY